MVIKSFLQCNAYTPSNFPISNDLLKDVSDARANYEKRMKQQASEDEERKRKAIEETLLKNVEAEKKKCARLTQLESGINEKEEAIANILKRKDQMLQVQKYALQ